VSLQALTYISDFFTESLHNEGMIKTTRKYSSAVLAGEKGDQTMSNTAKWTIGVVVAAIVLLFVAPFLWQWIFPGAYTGYGMMGGRGYGMHMPMMGYGYGFGLFGMLFMWLIPLGILALIVLGIAWLVKQLTTKTS
jgi:hypothetical protein